MRTGNCISGAKAAKLPRAIAHAGGMSAGMTYTNSLEALEEAHRSGFRCFEVDLNWTADGKLALIHDWRRTWKRLFPEQPRGHPRLAEFLAAPMSCGLTPLCLDGLLRWMRAREKALVVADVKQDNVAALENIVRAAPELQPRIIAQVYTPEELPGIRALGYKRILFTAYRSSLPAREIEDFVQNNKLTGLAAPVVQVEDGRFDHLLGEGRIPVFAHTVNDPDRWRQLEAAGVYGIFTDSLLVGD